MRSTLPFLVLVAMVLALASSTVATPLKSKSTKAKAIVRGVTLTRTNTMTRTVTYTPTQTVTRTTTALSGCTPAAKRKRDDSDEAAAAAKPEKLFFAKGAPLAVGHKPEGQGLEERSSEALDKRGIVWRVVVNTVTRTSTAPVRTATAVVTTTVCTGVRTTPTAVPATTAQSAPSTTSSITAPTNGLIVSDQLAFHNAKRALHFTATQNTPAMAWNNTLSQFALNYGLQCNSGHSGGPYGENLAWGAPPNAWSDQELFELWYDEEQGYNYSNNYFADATGHFTQLVWVGSSQLGCAIVTCPGSDAMFGASIPYKSLTCEYSMNRGNWQGYFVQNVLPPAVAGTK